MVKYVEFAFGLFLRFVSGAFFGGVVGVLWYWLPFLMGSAVGKLPWHLLTRWALVGGVIMMITVPRHQYPWRKPAPRD